MIKDIIRRKGHERIRRILESFALRFDDKQVLWAIHTALDSYDESTKDEGRFIRILLECLGRDIDMDLCREIERKMKSDI